MATTTNKPTAEGNTISAVAQTEGGTAKGSTSAAMQSELTRHRNAKTADDEVSAKLANAPEAVTSDDARYVQSREVRATGAVVSDLPSAAAKQAAANENEGRGGTTTTTANSNSNSISNATTATIGGGGSVGRESRDLNLDPSTQSQLDREANYVEAADTIQTKLEEEPGSVTKEEADSMHRREQRAFGHTDRGGLASRAQSQVAKNE
ncbi:hypothetical protein MMC14_000318 [Varicellaria rhodocarpa]|nr:hypothetical protein [Varicellaria rhodocarpa]